MKTSRLKELQRWFSDYERLSSDEAVALRGRDFPSLTRIQHLKPLFLEKIVSLAAELDLDRRDEWFNGRVEAITRQERENVALATGALRQAKIERGRFEGMRHRLRGLGHAYASDEGKNRPLLARI